MGWQEVIATVKRDSGFSSAIRMLKVLRGTDSRDKKNSFPEFPGKMALSGGVR